MPQVPLLEIPRKTTNEVDFGPPFASYIESFYQEDSSKYSSQIATLNRLRQDARGAGRDVTGRDLYYKYFGQLELISLRFPIQEDCVKIQFVWEDAFSSSKVSQHSVAFEKASVLFNVGATCSAIGALAERSDAQGLKTAYNYFQVAAGLFQYINDNFLHPPSVDLSRDSITVLVDLMLAQAQETFIEKVLHENKSGMLVAKLAMFVGDSYSTIREAMLVPALKNQWNPAWLALLKAKSKYFLALAHLHRSFVAEEKAAYGEIVTYLQTAEKYAQEAVKSTDSFLSFVGITAFLPSTFSPLAGTPTSPKALTIPALDTFIDTCNALLTTISTKLKVAIKDNDMIYNATVPSIETLTPIDKLKAVKTLRFQDLLPSEKDLATIIGPDLFDKLIPINVHESASVYSDAKDAIMRKQKRAVVEMEEEQIVMLRSLPLDLVKSLKRFFDGDGERITVPKDLIDSINSVGVDERNGGLHGLASKISSLTEDSKKTVDEIMQILNTEQYDNEQMQVLSDLLQAKYLQDWRMEPSSVKNRSMVDEVRNNDSRLKQLSGQGQSIVSKLTGLRNFLELTKLPHSSLSAKFIADVDQTSVKSPIDLLDESVADSDTAPERNLVNKILAMVERLRLITKDAKLCLEELVRKIQSDDISSILMLNHGREEEIYKAELGKFSQFENQLEAMAKDSQQILTQISQDINHLQQNSKTLQKLENIESNCKGLTKQWENDLLMYMETKSSLDAHLNELKDVSRSLLAVKNSAINFANQRLLERQTLMAKIDSDQAEASQRALRAQLDRLQVGGSSSTFSASSSSPVGQNALPPPNYGITQPGGSRNQTINPNGSPYPPPQQLYSAPVPQGGYGGQGSLQSPQTNPYSQPGYQNSQIPQGYPVGAPSQSNNHRQSTPQLYPAPSQPNYSYTPSSLPPPSTKLYSTNQYNQPPQPQHQSLYSTPVYSQQVPPQNPGSGYQPQPQYPPANHSQNQQYPPVHQTQFGQANNPNYPQPNDPPRPPSNLLD